MSIKLFISIKYLLLFMLIPAVLYAAEGEPVWWKQVSDEAETDGYSLVSINDLKKLYESKKPFLIIDTRTEYEYNEGYLPDAVTFEFNPGDKLQLKPEKKKAFLELLGPDKDRKIIIYCRSFRCLRSGIAAAWAVRLGYKDVSRFPEGFFEWRDGGLEVIKQTD